MATQQPQVFVLTEDRQMLAKLYRQVLDDRTRKFLTQPLLIGVPPHNHNVVAIDPQSLNPSMNAYIVLDDDKLPTIMCPYGFFVSLNNGRIHFFPDPAELAKGSFQTAFPYPGLNNVVVRIIFNGNESVSDLLAQTRGLRIGTSGYTNPDGGSVVRVNHAEPIEGPPNRFRIPFRSGSSRFGRHRAAIESTIRNNRQYRPLFEDRTGNLRNIKRPPNAFILYRQAKHAEYIASGVKLSIGEFSRIIGERWANETEATKAHYRERAEEAARRHRLLYPNYRYRPRPSQSISRRNVGGNRGQTGHIQIGVAAAPVNLAAAALPAGANNNQAPANNPPPNAAPAPAPPAPVPMNVAPGPQQAPPFNAGPAMAPAPIGSNQGAAVFQVPVAPNPLPAASQALATLNTTGPNAPQVAAPLNPGSTSLQVPGASNPSPAAPPAPAPLTTPVAPSQQTAQHEPESPSATQKSGGSSGGCGGGSAGFGGFGGGPGGSSSGVC